MHSINAYYTQTAMWSQKKDEQIVEYGKDGRFGCFQLVNSLLDHICSAAAILFNYFDKNKEVI